MSDRNPNVCPAMAGALVFLLFPGCAPIVGLVLLPIIAFAAAVFGTSCVLSVLSVEYAIWSLVGRRSRAALIVIAVGAIFGLLFAFGGATAMDREEHLGVVAVLFAWPYFVVGFGGAAGIAAAIFLVIDIARTAARAIAAVRRGPETPQPLARRSGLLLGVLLLAYHGVIMPVAAVGPIVQVGISAFNTGGPQMNAQDLAYWIGLLLLSIPSFVAAAGIFHQRRFGRALAIVASGAMFLIAAIARVAGMDAIGPATFVLCAVPPVAVWVSALRSGPIAAAST